jgi:hypothetical protein
MGDDEQVATIGSLTLGYLFVSELEISTLITQFLQNNGNESNGQIWLSVSFYYVCIFMNISVLSIFKQEAKQKLKATVPPVKQYFFK